MTCTGRYHIERVSKNDWRVFHQSSNGQRERIGYGTYNEARSMAARFNRDAAKA